MGVIADNYEMWERWDAEREDSLAKLPKCGYCEDPITEDYFFIINRTFVCESCLMKEHRHFTVDYE